MSKVISVAAHRGAKRPRKPLARHVIATWLIGAVAAAYLVLRLLGLFKLFEF